jgi:hypothetical protein
MNLIESGLAHEVLDTVIASTSTPAIDVIQHAVPEGKHDDQFAGVLHQLELRPLEVSA